MPISENTTVPSETMAAASEDTASYATPGTTTPIRKDRSLETVSPSAFQQTKDCPFAVRTTESPILTVSGASTSTPGQAVTSRAKLVLNSLSTRDTMFLSEYAVSDLASCFNMYIEW